MSLEKMFASIDTLRSTASVEAAFGQPQEVEGKVLIPVAEVGMGFGLGFGKGVSESEEEPAGEGEGGGGGGGANSRPIAVIQVTQEDTTICPIQDEGKIALAGIALVAWCVFWFFATLESIFGKD
ncbi:MAG: hypothetical protein JW934_09925 [Anaerolineae bacterium]|nr:hypothetical protein [Anaerolineae bacterium]